MRTNVRHSAFAHTIAVAMCAAALFAHVPAFADGLININTANRTALETLNGIGEVKAQAIIDYREANGPFTAIEDIQNVSGIGPATFAKIKDHITVQSAGSSSTSDSEPDPDPPAASAQESSGVAGHVSSYVPPPTPELYADAGGDRTVIVGADTRFRARAYNDGQEIVEQVRFSWNFGDGSTAEGADVFHHFAYPGRYAVVLTIAEERETASDRIVVEAIAADIALSALADGGVALENRAAADLDLSRWIVRSSAAQFILPEHSSVLAGQTMRISAKTLGFFAGSNAELLYPNGTLAVRAGAAESEPPPAQAQIAPAPAPLPQEPAEKKETVKTETPPVAEREAPASAMALATSSQVAAVAASGSWKWFSGALALTLVGAGSAYAARRLGRKEWNIIEDTAE